MRCYCGKEYPLSELIAEEVSENVVVRRCPYCGEVVSTVRGPLAKRFIKKVEK